MTKILGYDIDDVLMAVGLGRKRTTLEDILPAIGLVAAGAAIGVGVGLIFAPATGSHLRRDLLQGVEGRLQQLRARMQREPKQPHANGSASQAS